MKTTMITHINRVLLLTVIPCFLLCIQTAVAQPHKAKIDSLVENGGYVFAHSNFIIAGKNENSRFIPASILKIATSLASLRILGPDFRFETAFYLTNENDLYIKGFGDPSLTSEEIAGILANLKKQGVACINNIFLDAGAFQLQPTGTNEKSLNPYDAQNAALAVNFNTIHFTKKEDGSIISAEEQTPTLPIMLRLGKDLPPGTHRIQITQNMPDILTYAGQLFRGMQQRLKIAGDGVIAEKNIPEILTPLYMHKSRKTLEEIISGLMLYSNNFIANQLFLTCGAYKQGYPATWQKGRSTLEEFLSTLDLSEKQIIMQEGSGLSTENRVTPATMLKILQAFQPHAELLPMDNKGRLIKSGTLTGVYCYAGYFRANNKKDPFVIILNQQKNTRDQVLDLLEKEYREMKREF